jgi:hypothetical protein
VSMVEWELNWLEVRRNWPWLNGSNLLIINSTEWRKTRLQAGTKLWAKETADSQGDWEQLSIEERWTGQWPTPRMIMECCKNCPWQQRYFWPCSRITRAITY